MKMKWKCKSLEKMVYFMADIPILLSVFALTVERTVKTVTNLKMARLLKWASLIWPS